MRKKIPARIKKTIAIAAGSAAILCFAVALVVTTVVIPKRAYNAQERKYGRETVETFYALEERDEYLFRGVRAYLRRRRLRRRQRQ